jgi:hypothetical protein
MTPMEIYDRLSDIAKELDKTEPSMDVQIMIADLQADVLGELATEYDVKELIDSIKAIGNG